MDDHRDEIAGLKRLLEAELERQTKPHWGCWPLLVGALGVLLGLALLAERL